MDKRIRVCVMMPKFHIGGAEVQVMGLLRNIDRSRFAVHLCLFGHGVSEMEEEASSLVEEIYYLDFRWRYLPVSFLKLVKYLQDGRFDVLHAHLAFADLIGRIVAWMAGVPIRITTEHGKGLWKSGFQVMIEQTMNRITDMRICVSRDILRIRKEREHTDGSKLAYIPNAVDTSSFGGARRSKADIMKEFGWDPAAPLVLSVGRVVEAKNYPLLVRAVSDLSRKIPEVKCLIAGDGRCRGEVETAITEDGLENTVRLAGSRNDIADLLGAADLFVLSSDREGLPVTLLEAMASETPIVSTDVGGISEAVSDRESALLVPGRGYQRVGRSDGRCAFRSRSGCPVDGKGTRNRKGQVQHPVDFDGSPGYIRKTVQGEAADMTKPEAVPVVMYHGVAPDRPEWIWNHLVTPVDVFDGQMKALKENGWNTITLKQLYSHMKDGDPLPKKPVVLTFDDGYLDNWVYAYPILKKYGHHAVIWMTTDFIDPCPDPRPRMDDAGIDGSHEKGLESLGFLSFAEMRVMEESGHAEIQSHALTHTWYFSGEKILDYHRPAGKDGYDPLPWLSWNAVPEKKYEYMSRDLSGDLPFGSPVYKHERALVVRKYFDDENLARRLAAHVAAHGGAGFFDMPVWRGELDELVTNYGSPAGRYETDEEYEDRVRHELAGSRSILSRGLGRDIDFLCWPGGGFNDTTLRIASEEGCLATTTDYHTPGRKNVHGERPDRINRIGCASPWMWRGNVSIKNTDPGFFIASLDGFTGKKRSIWKMRCYKIKYLIRYFLTGNK